MQDNTNNVIWFVYDGECPLCQMGVSLYKVRQSVGQLYIVDARTEKDHPIIQEINQAELNLDDGMVIKYQGRLYQGSEALSIMANIGDDQGFFNKISNRLFRSKILAKACYPFMRGARNIVIGLKGAGKIHNLRGIHVK